MDLRNWLQQWLGIYDLHQKVVELENRMNDIESNVANTLQHFGNYQNRTESELTLMQGQLYSLVETISNVIESAENQSDIQRASRLRSKLRNNLTRVNRALADRAA